MTDKSKTPEKIWALVEDDWHCGETGENFIGGTWDDGTLKNGCLFIREDVAVVAALEEAVDEVYQECWTDGLGGIPEIVKVEQDTTVLAMRAIQSLINDDARAALDRLIAEAVEDEREACASLVETFGALDHDHLADAIRARKNPLSRKDGKT